MSLKEFESKDIATSETELETWIATILPGLKTRWADYLFSLPANQPTPHLSDWLALLHAAATKPAELISYLSKLLKLPAVQVEPINDWLILTDLFRLTVEAARAEADKLTAADWQNLVELQTRILKVAAQMADYRRVRPSTGTLSQRSLYLQTITQLNKKRGEINLLNEILDETLALIQHNFGYEYVHLFLLDTARQSLILQHAAWLSGQPKPEDFITLSFQQGLVGRVAATGQGILVNDGSTHLDFLPHPALPNITSQLCMPLFVAQNLVGVLDLESQRLDAFTEEDYHIAQALAGDIALLIENAQLNKSLQRYIKEQTVIYENIVTLGAKLDMETVLKLMNRKITEVMNAGACVISRIDEKDNSVTALSEYVAHYPGNPPHTWRRLNTPSPIAKDIICQQLLKAARPIISRADLKNTDKPWPWQLPANSPGRKTQWHAMLALPLESHNRVTGLIEIYDRSPKRAFSSEDIKFCRILATQTALAMEQAALFEEMLGRLGEVSMLYTMAQKISGSLDLEDVLNTIVTSLREVIGCRACCIFLLDETGHHLEIKAASGLKPHWRKIARLQVGEGAAGLAAAEGRTIYLPDTHQDPNFIFFDKEVRSLMVVPLAAQGKITGTINVDDDHPNAFDHAQERLLTIAAAQAGIMIENARLFTKISAEQQQMQTIIQHMADGVLLIDGQGVIITCNSTLAMMLGMHPGQIISQNIHSPHLDPNLASITATTTHQARTGVLVKEVMIESPRPRTVQVFSTVMVDDHRNSVGEVRLVHDVTKERELERLKDEFFSTISHDLRTPLFSIHGFAQLMLEDNNLDQATQKEFLATIQRQALQLSEMVNNLLDLSKLDAGKLEFEKKPISLLDLIHQIVLKLQGFAHQQEVKLSPDLPALLPTVIGDSQRLEQVLTNLIGNAIKFSPAGEKVVIIASAARNQILVQIKDNGPGIPVEELDQIFSRYYQGSSSRQAIKGSGLGLHIAKKIVEGHGGRIWAENGPGQGSTFSFTLPLVH